MKEKGEIRFFHDALQFGLKAKEVVEFQIEIGPIAGEPEMISSVNLAISIVFIQGTVVCD